MSAADLTEAALRWATDDADALHCDHADGCCRGLLGLACDEAGA